MAAARGVYSTLLDVLDAVEENVQDVARHHVNALEEMSNLDDCSQGPTALQSAAKMGRTEIVYMLCEAGADIDKTGGEGWSWTPLVCAIANDNPAAVYALLHHGADIFKKTTKSAQSIPVGSTAIDAAQVLGRGDLVEVLLHSALLNAIEANDAASIEAHLHAGARPNDCFLGPTALQLAVQLGHRAIVERLCAAGADVNLTGGEGWSWTPLVCAIANRQPTVVPVLLRHRADVLIKTTRAAGGIAAGSTAIDAARVLGQSDLVAVIAQSSAPLSTDEPPSVALSSWLVAFCGFGVSDADAYGTALVTLGVVAPANLLAVREVEWPTLLRLLPNLQYVRDACLTSVGLRPALQRAHRMLAACSQITAGHDQRFASDPCTLVFGSPQQAALGLVDYLCVAEGELFRQVGNGIAAIQQEFAFASAEDQECLRYALHEEAGSSKITFQDGLCRDCGSDGCVLCERQVADEAGGQRGMRLADFVAHPHARIAKLLPAEVLALRLYSMATFQTINNQLRDMARYAQHTAHTLAVTVFCLQQGIKKLRAVAASRQDANLEMELWRGVKHAVAPPEFLERGGSELAPLSTSASLEVAVRYSSASATRVLFRLRAANFMKQGADISFVSAFPAEQEFVYPPLTYLAPSASAAQEMIDVDGVVYQVVEVVPDLA
jgi:ankyrin repeat protein